MNISCVKSTSAKINGVIKNTWQMTPAELEKVRQMQSDIRRKRRAAARNRHASKRTNYAAQVLDRGNAMAELVSRVNQAATPAPAIANDPIPFDGSCQESPEETTGRDWYGV